MRLPAPYMVRMTDGYRQKMIDSKKARPDVAVRVAGTVVAVQVEKAVVLVAVIVTTAVQDYATRGIVAEHRKKTSDYWEGRPKKVI